MVGFFSTQASARLRASSGFFIARSSAICPRSTSAFAGSRAAARSNAARAEGRRFRKQVDRAAGYEHWHRIGERLFQRFQRHVGLGEVVLREQRTNERQMGLGTVRRVSNRRLGEIHRRVRIAPLQIQPRELCLRRGGARVQSDHLVEGSNRFVTMTERCVDAAGEIVRACRPGVRRLRPASRSSMPRSVSCQRRETGPS